MELFSNFGATKFNGAINSSVTSIVVVDATVFPPTGNFRVTSDDEIMIVTAVSGNTLTVLRGQEGSTAIAHADQGDLIHVLTKGSLMAFRSDSVGRDTYANRLAAGAAGRLYFEKDYPNWNYDDGTNWNVLGRVSQFVPPVDANYAWVNQGGATVTTSQDGIILNCPFASGDNFRIRKKAAPATPYTITAYIGFTMMCQNYHQLGLCWRDSVSGKFAVYGMKVGYFMGSQLNSPTNWNNDYSGAVATDNLAFDFPWGGGGWIRMSDDGTNRKVFLSNDGQNWVLFHSAAHTDFMTPNEVGFFGNANHSLYDLSVRLYSWEET